MIANPGDVRIVTPFTVQPDEFASTIVKLSRPAKVTQSPTVAPAMEVLQLHCRPCRCLALPGVGMPSCKLQLVLPSHSTPCTTSGQASGSERGDNSNVYCTLGGAGGAGVEDLAAVVVFLT